MSMIGIERGKPVNRDPLTIEDQTKNADEWMSRRFNVFLIEHECHQLSPGVMVGCITQEGWCFHPDLASVVVIQETFPIESIIAE